MTKQLSWFHEILELQDESYDASEFMEGVKGDIFSDKVYVFTPKETLLSYQRIRTIGLCIQYPYRYR